MLMEWKKKRRENDDPKKKVLAETLLELDSNWKEEDSAQEYASPVDYKHSKKPDLIKLASETNTQG